LIRKEGERDMLLAFKTHNDNDEKSNLFLVQFADYN